MKIFPMFLLLVFFVCCLLPVTVSYSADYKTYVGVVSMIDAKSKQFSITVKKTGNSMVFKASSKILSIMKDGDTVRVYVKPGTKRVVQVDVIKRVHAKKQKPGGSTTPFIPPGGLK